MRCPYCRTRDSRVTDSRATDDGIRRRRQCVVCGERFTTFETVQLSAVQIIKKDGRREDFNREKLLAGLRKACAKREISVAELEGVVSDIEARITSGSQPEVPSTLIGEMAMDALRKLDHIAYIRFASVYRPFTDLGALREAVTALEEGRIPSVEERSLQLALPVDEAGVAPPARLVRDIRAAGGGR